MRKPTANWTGLPEPLRGFLSVSILAIISALFLWSCASRKPTVQTSQTIRTEREIIRDTNIVVLPDSATINALFECDSLNRVVMTENERIKGERITPDIKTQSNPDGSMQVDFSCHEDSLTLELQLRDKIISELQATIQTLEVEKHLGKWDSFCIVCGYILMGLFALIIIIFVVKLFIR